MRTTSLVPVCGLLLAVAAVVPAMAQDNGPVPLDQVRAGPPVRVAAKPVVGADVGGRPMIGQYTDPLANYVVGDSIGTVASSMVALQAPDLRATMPMAVVTLSTLPSAGFASAMPVIPTIVVPQITLP